MMKNFLLFTFLSLWFALPAFAQQTISGKVIDAELQEPLIGASVVVTSTTKGTITDVNGRFSLELASGENSLTVSFLGYETVTLDVSTRSKTLVISLKPSSEMLNEIKVEGFQTDRTLQETAASISVLGAKELERNNLVSLVPLLNTQPGIQIAQSSLDNSRVTIRGIGARSQAGARGVKVYFNGIPFTEPDGFTRLEGIDLAAIGRVEVIRGPGSSIYGAANGGVMNFSTQKAEFDNTSLSYDGLVGSYGLMRNRAIFRHGDERSNIYLSWGVQEWDGYRDWNSGVRHNFNFFGQFYAGENLTINALFTSLNDVNQSAGQLTAEQVREDRTQQAFVSSGVTGAPVGPVSAWDNRREQFWTRFGVSVQYDFSDVVSVMGSAFGGFYDQLFTVPNVNIVQAEAQSYGTRSMLTVKPRTGGTFKPVFQAGIEYQTLRQPGVNRGFQAPFDVGGDNDPTRQDLTGFYNDYAPAGDLQLNSTNNFENTTIFAQAELQFTEKLIATLGASYNLFTYGREAYFESGIDAEDLINSEREYDPVLTPRIALNYNFSPAAAVRASWSTGFTPPIGNEAFTRDDNGNLIYNDELDASTSSQFELGVRGAVLDKRLTYDLAIYQINIDNELVTETVNFAPTARNAGETRRQGVELSLGYNIFRPEDKHSFFKSLRPYLSYTYQNFEYVSYTKETVYSAPPTPPFFGVGTVEENFDGKKLPGNAPHLLTLGLDFESNIGLYFNASYFFVDEMFLNDANEGFQVQNSFTGTTNFFTFPAPTPTPVISDDDAKQAAYSVLNAKIGYRNTFGPISLDVNFGVDNILNEEYSAFVRTNDAQGRFFFPALPTNFYGGIRLGYNF